MDKQKCGISIQQSTSQQYKGMNLAVDTYMDESLSNYAEQSRPDKKEYIP